MMSRIDCRHWKNSTGHHFQNGHHNTANIQHCPVSSKFDMWVDNDVPNWSPTLTNFYRSPFSKLATTIPHKFNIVRFQRHFICVWIMMSRIDSCNRKFSTGRHFQNGHHNTTQIQHCPISTPFHMWVDYDVPNWFLTSKNFYRSPFSKRPPQYRTNSTLFDINKITYVGRLWWPELIPDVEKCLPVSIFKMVATIPQKFNIVRFQR